MKPQKNNILSSIRFFFLASLLIVAGCQSSDQATDISATQNSSPNADNFTIPAPKNRDVMPAFVLPTLNGGSFDSSGQQGRVLLVNFWATWCAPCREEIPDLVALQRELGSDTFSILGISMDEDDASFVKEFADMMEINYDVVVDDGEVAEAFGGVYALPTTFVVDKKGKITHRTIGLFPVDSVKEEIVQMIQAD